MKTFNNLRGLMTSERNRRGHIESSPAQNHNCNSPDSVPLPTPPQIVRRRVTPQMVTETSSPARRLIDRVASWAHSLSSSTSQPENQPGDLETPAPMVGFSLRDETRMDEEESQHPETEKSIKEKIKTNKITKSKKKHSSKTKETKTKSEKKQSIGTAPNNQSRSKGKRAHEADNDDKRSPKKVKNKAAESEKDKLDNNNRGGSVKKVKKLKSEFLEETPKSKKRSQSKRNRTEADNDSNRPRKRAKSKSPGKSSTSNNSKSYGSHRESGERGRGLKKVQFRSPLKESKSPSKISSTMKRIRARQPTPGPTQRPKNDNYAESEDDITSSDDARYSYEDDSEYGGNSASQSPDYHGRYSDDENDYDYNSAAQSPDHQDRYSDVKITRGERNDLLNELTRERGKRLVESMEIPRDPTIEEDQMKLFKKLAIRGCKPIMSGEWASDFPTLPNALFTRVSDEPSSDDEENLPFEPKWGSSNYAIKALQEVFAIGGRVRDAEYLTISQQVVIERSIRKYMQRVMYSAGLHTVKSAIPVHTIASQKAGEDLVATLDRATKSLRGLMWRHVESHEIPTEGTVHWPVLIGFVIAGPILCLLSLDGNPDSKANLKTPDEPVVRFMTHVDFSHAPFDVWNSLAAVICISHVRDTSLRLATLWEGSPTVHRFRDNTDETNDEDL